MIIYVLSYKAHFPACAAVTTNQISLSYKDTANKNIQITYNKI